MTKLGGDLGWVEGNDGASGSTGLGGSPEPRGGSQDGSGRGVWVPWETEAANSSPERLKVRARRQAFPRVE